MLFLSRVPNSSAHKTSLCSGTGDVYKRQIFDSYVAGFISFCLTPLFVTIDSFSRTLVMVSVVFLRLSLIFIDVYKRQPFISYARLAPNVFSMEYDMKVSDVDPSLEITHKEVIPMIYEAANACRPPLFKDQPQEKININSKLGFGMNSELKLYMCIRDRDNVNEVIAITPSPVSIPLNPANIFVRLEAIDTAIGMNIM